MSITTFSLSSQSKSEYQNRGQNQQRSSSQTSLILAKIQSDVAIYFKRESPSINGIVINLNTEKIPLKLELGMTSGSKAKLSSMRIGINIFNCGIRIFNDKCSFSLYAITKKVVYAERRIRNTFQSSEVVVKRSEVFALV